MAEAGKKIFEAKCLACHKLNDEKMVGPGWLGITKQNAPEWVMNYMTNTDAMLDEDIKSKTELQKYMARMPNQNLSADDARNVLEFMRKNDGVQ